MLRPTTEKSNSGQSSSSPCAAAAASTPTPSTPIATNLLPTSRRHRMKGKRRFGGNLDGTNHGGRSSSSSGIQLFTLVVIGVLVSLSVIFTLRVATNAANDYEAMFSYLPEGMKELIADKPGALNSRHHKKNNRQQMKNNNQQNKNQNMRRNQQEENQDIDIPTTKPPSKKKNQPKTKEAEPIVQEQSSRGVQQESLTKTKSTIHLSNNKKDRKQILAGSNKAYAFFLGGIPTPPRDGSNMITPSLVGRSSGMPFRYDSYRGLLYNILVSVKTLRDAGSTADMILLVHMATANAELPSDQVDWLTQLGIRIQYVPTAPSVVNEFSTVPFEKFRILDLVEYKRVLFMDADVTPHCNLDYIMDHSMVSAKNPQQTLLQENFVVSVGRTPVTGAFFMLTPGPGKFDQLMKLMINQADSIGWSDTPGWGKKHSTKVYKWRALGQVGDGDSFTYPGANSEQGLLHYWTRVNQGNVSIAIGDTIENWENGVLVKNLTDNPLKKYSCLPEAQKTKVDRSDMFAEGYEEKHTSPNGIAPYRDFSQWFYAKKKPWYFKQAPQIESKNDIQTPVDRWFHTLRSLDQELQLGLEFNFKRDNNQKKKKGKGENIESNWNFVQEKNLISVKPAWSTTVKAAVQWALRNYDNPNTSYPWEPPEMEMGTTTTETAADLNLRTFCKCKNPIHTDPCSQKDQSLEEWLQVRSPLKLSADRPLCPNAARNFMHVVVPVSQTTDQAAQSSLCSVICQDYPPERLSVYMYTSGARPNNFMVNACGKESLLEFDPLRSETKGKKRPAGFEGLAQSRVLESVETYKGQRNAMGQHGGVDFLACLHPKSRVAQSEAKYWALRHVEAHASANDIVLVLDAANELASHRALQYINHKFTEKEAWSFFVSHEGAPPLTSEGEDFSPRHSLPLQSLGSPFGFKTHLLSHISFEEFAAQDAAVAEHGYFYRMLELSGTDRIVAATQPVTKHNSAPNSARAAPADIASQMQQIQKSKPSTRLDLPLEVVLTCPSPILVGEQLKWLQVQSFAKGRTISVNLLIESPEMERTIEKSVNAFLTKQDGMVAGAQPIVVKLQKDFNTGQTCSNFLFATGLREEKPLDRVVFLDGNQYWSPTYLSRLWEQHLPRGMTTWGGKRYEEPNQKSKLADYIRPTYSSGYSVLAKGKHMDVKRFTILESGGSIFDANFWLLDGQLDRLQNSTENVCDVFVSYALDALLGWSLRRLETDTIPIDVPNSDVDVIEKKIIPKLPKGTGNTIRNLRTRVTELINRPNRDRQIPPQAAANLFHELQSKFHWHVLDRPKTENAPPLSIIPQKRYDSADNLGAAQNVDGEKRAFVCVTGQFDRFEGDSKIKNLIAPLQQAGYKIDIALVLSHKGETAFTNQDLKERKKIKTDSQPFYTSFEDAAADFEKNDVNVLFRQNGTYPKVQDPPFHKDYFGVLYAIQGRGKEQQTSRVLNHARIFDSYVRCLKYADAASLEATGKPVSSSNPYYDVFIRIRDDVGPSRPLKNSLITDIIPPPPNSVIVTPCRSWQGINDRFAIVSPDAARAYFERPYDVVSTNKSIDIRVVRNPESFLLFVFTTAKLNVLTHPGLPNLNRMYLSSEGKVSINTGDANPNCPKSKFYTYLDRLWELYNWYM